MPGRIRSLTILNTMIEVHRFRRPLVMEPFAHRGLGPLALRTLNKPAFRALMPLQAIGDMSAVRPEELDAYIDLVKRDDGGAAFLRIMRGFERTPAKRDLLRSAVRGVPYPVQVVWGEGDPSLRVDVEGEDVRRAAELDLVHRVPGRHFLQEDHAPAIAERVAALA
jgi:pimeloyl-ACP methyl ester carboxylesterase